MFLFLLFITIVLAYLYSTRNFNYWKKRNVPYIKPIPIFGNMLPAFTLKQHYGEWLSEKYKLIEEGYFGIFSFDEPVFVVKSPQLIKSILLKDFSYFEDRPLTTPENDEILSNLMFFKKNPGWKKIRAKMTPAFTTGKLKLMFPLIFKEGQTLVDYVKKNGKVESIEAKELCAKYATNVIARSAFAVDANCFENDKAHFREIGRSMFDLTIANAFRQFSSRFFPRLVKMFNLSFFNVECVSNMREIFLDVLNERKKLVGHTQGNDLIDIMLQVRDNQKDHEDFTENAMVGQAIMFFAAGFETSSSTMAFCLYELAIHPEIQEKLRKEISETMTTNNGILTYEAINDMKYLDMCFCETLRKYPVLPSLDRLCKTDYQVPGTDLIIEKGVAVYVPVLGLHYDKKYFPEPEKFDPERFADKNAINKDGFYYLPFGEGPRNCIGARFGIVSVKSGLSKIVLNFKIEKAADTPVPIVFEPKSFPINAKDFHIPITLTPLS